MNKNEIAKINKIKRELELCCGLEELYIEDNLPDDKFLLWLKIKYVCKFIDGELSNDYWAIKLKIKKGQVRYLKKILNGKSYSGEWR